MNKKSTFRSVANNYLTHPKNNLGITLISLIITIIILIILATISLRFLNGENNLISKSENAVIDAEQAKLEKDVDTAYVFYTQQIGSLNDLEYYLNKIQGANIEKTSSDSWYVSRGKAGVTVSANGEKIQGQLARWDGTSIECPDFKEFNWYIYTPTQLKFLADFVNNGNSLTGTTDLTSIVTNAGYRTSDVTMTETTIVYLMNNLDMGARAGTGSTEEEKWNNAENEAKKWTPIGIGLTTGAKFIGTFEGNSHYIQGLYVNQETNYFAGIFGCSNTIQNLTIKDSYIEGKSGTGGIVGALMTGKIENCHNINTTVILKEGSNFIVGGIVGQISDGTEGIFNCSNTGMIIANGSDSNGVSQAGGIAGRLQTTAENCQNSGEIIGKGSNVSGIVGSTTPNSSTITGCTNRGNITVKGECIAGVVGYLDESCTITSCTNSGNVTGENKFVGGIAGYSLNSSVITGCTNRGNITGKGERVGGIAGEIETSSTVTNCTNRGNVTGENKLVGGIAGYAYNSSAITNCTNNGNITGKGERVGGIAGEIETSSTVTNCTNNGEVLEIGTGDFVGGIVGIGFGTVDKCVNKAKVTAKSSTGSIGGIVGEIGIYCTGIITNCYNTGDVEGSGNGTGGIVGWLSLTGTSGKVQNNYNIGQITGETNVGGVVGRTAGSFDVRNNYALANSAPTISNSERKESSEMKTDAFITLLNTVTIDGETTTQDVWKRDTSNKNNGYPLLNWQ